jgi:large subunit ribosomal protein L23
MKTSHDIIKNIIRTEKGNEMLVDNKYVFRVDKRANKIEVKSAVETIYKVKVLRVNIMNLQGKKKRVRFHQGMTPSWKKAIVTLHADNRIEVT